MRTVKGIRSDLGLTQVEMAKELNMSDVTYRNIENYKTDMSANTLIRISQMANIDPRDILLINTD